MLELVSPSAKVSLAGLSFREYGENFPIYRRLLQTRCDEVRIPPDIQNGLIGYPDQLNWVVVVDEESPDTAAILPIIYKMTSCSPRFNFTITPAERDFTHLEQLISEDDLDDDLAEMEFPLLLLFDEEWNLQAYWGPRPEAADSYLEAWLEENPTYEQLAVDDSPESQCAYLALLMELTQTMRTWYNSELDGCCIKEIYALLTALQDESQSNSDTAED